VPRLEGELKISRFGTSHGLSGLNAGVSLADLCETLRLCEARLALDWSPILQFNER